MGILLYSVLVKFYFLNLTFFANFYKSCICLSQISPLEFEICCFQAKLSRFRSVS